MSEKKMVSRNVAMALGIICIILIALIAYFTVSGISAQNSYNNLQNQNNQLQSDKRGLQNNNTALQYQIYYLNSTYNSYVSAHSHTDSEYNAVEAAETIFYNQTIIEAEMLNLAEYDVLVNQTISQPADSFSDFGFGPSNAGYVSVDVNSSTTPNTYVRVFYNSTTTGIHYDTSIIVGISGVADFPVVPSSVQVEVGNTNLVNGANETVTITYYY